MQAMQEKDSAQKIGISEFSLQLLLLTVVLASYLFSFNFRLPLKHCGCSNIGIVLILGTIVRPFSRSKSMQPFHLHFQMSVPFILFCLRMVVTFEECKSRFQIPHVLLDKMYGNCSPNPFAFVSN
jgi:hypothetical protein